MSRTPDSGRKPSEDELAREMIARIARQVDLEMGRVPLEPTEEAEEGEGEADADGGAAAEVEKPVAEAAPAPRPGDRPAERSEADVSRELVERIAREVDEELHG